MPTGSQRISEHLLVEADDNEIILKYRDEVGRGKRFGMDGNITLDAAEADTLAKWIFVRQLEADAD